MPQKTAVIALDGFPHWLLEKWLFSGCLPNIAAAFPTFGMLLSPVPTSPVAWTTFAVGRSPWEHQIWGFLQSGGRRDRRWSVVNAASIPFTTLWQRVAREGGTAVAAYYPMSYPASVSAAGMANISIISGWIGIPPGAVDVLWPESLAVRLGESGFEWEPRNQADTGQCDLDMYLREAKRLLHRREALFMELLKTRPDLFVGVFFDTDRVLHQAMARLTKDIFDKDVLGYFQELDLVVGRLMSELHDYHVVVVSDHGMRLCKRTIDLNIWLLRHKFVKVNCRPISLLRFLTWRLGLTPELVRSILKYFRTAGVEKTLLKKHRRLADRLRPFFLNYRDVHGPFAESLGILHAHGKGDQLLAAIEACPDLRCSHVGSGSPLVVCAIDPEVIVIGRRTMQGNDPFGSPLEPGQHSVDGIFMSSEIRLQLPGTLQEASAVVANSLGISHPGDLIEVLESALSAEETAAVEQRLRALGYI